MRMNFQKAMADPEIVIGGMGWRPDPPSARDWNIKRKLQIVDVSRLPRKVDLTMHDSPVRNQGNLGSCVGFSTCAAVEHLRRTDMDLYSTIYSPLWQYYQARAEEGPEWIGIDAGAYIRLSMNALRRLGVPPESNWPYVEERFKRAPTSSVVKAAARWKLGAHYRCETLADVLNALANNWPVVIGFTCYASMFTRAVSASGVIPLPALTSSDYEVGGHAVKLSGYDMDAQTVILKNSWGEEWGKVWGKPGYGSLPFRFLQDRNLGDDFWACQAEAA